MIRRKGQRESEVVEDRPKGFDDYDVRLGDMMRGERATMGKSLLDVQRELRIRASYIASIENCDPSGFETPGFIAGYVRSYARYLGLDPEQAFDQFCAESGFATAHGMSAEASTIRKSDQRQVSGDRDPFEAPVMPFTPEPESLLSRIEPRAIGSSLVLVALISAIGFGAWSVLNQIQRVQVAPVDQTPVVASDLDPLKEVTLPRSADLAQTRAPAADSLDRIYRPQALDVPVLASRDAPISTLDPSSTGVFKPEVPFVVADAPVASERDVPQVVADAAPEVVLLAVRPAWVRVKGADDTIVLEKILNAGEEFVVPATEVAPTLRAGMGGSIYVKLNGAVYGPLGEGTNTVSGIELDMAALEQSYDLADLDSDPALQEVIAVAEAAAAAEAVQE